MLKFNRIDFDKIHEEIASLEFKFFQHNIYIYILANDMNSIYCAQEST